MRSSDWSSDVCSSDVMLLKAQPAPHARQQQPFRPRLFEIGDKPPGGQAALHRELVIAAAPRPGDRGCRYVRPQNLDPPTEPPRRLLLQHHGRSEEPTSELQSLMRSSHAVFCLK